MILLVEDDYDLRNGLADYIREEGFHVVTASSGEEAIQVIEGLTEDPDVIFTDLMMPGMNGWDFLNYLDRHGLCIGVPSYAVTADGVDAKFTRHVTFIKKPTILFEVLAACRKHSRGATP